MLRLTSCLLCVTGAWMNYTDSESCITHSDTPKIWSGFDTLFVWWLIQGPNIWMMSSFTWLCMIHSGLFDLWKSQWLTVQISSAGQAAQKLQHWHGQKRNSFCPNRCFISIQCPNPHSGSSCRKSVNLSCFTQQTECTTSLSPGGQDWFSSATLQTNMALPSFFL